MSRKQSFEDALRQKLHELPLPDENASWENMNALLTETKKRRPFLFFRNEKMVGGALLLCALLVWFALFIQKENKTTKPIVYINNRAHNINEDKQANGADSIDNTEKVKERKNPAQIHSDNALSSLKIPTATPSFPSANNQFSSQKKKRTAGKKQGDFEEKNVSSVQSKHRNSLEEKNDFSAQLLIRRKIKGQVQQTDNSVLQKKDEIAEGSAPERKQKSTFADSSMQSPVVINHQSTASVDSTDNSRNKETIGTNLKKTDSASANITSAKTSITINPRSTWFVDAGIGIKQQLPIDSQRFVSYSYNGNQSWFGDYIPFLYVKLEKERKWFLQGEFHYAAPRLINGVSYWQKSKVDYAHSTASTERYYLQKVWYHEVPLSLNIYLRPSWSVGGGAMYSWLHGAAVQRTISEYDVSSGQFTGRYEQIPWKGFTDSFLYKTNMSLLLQTDYGIKRWSFGLRYLHDIQPYLIYTLPDGRKKEERNTSLELLIRYRLYRSDKFRMRRL